MSLPSSSVRAVALWVALTAGLVLGDARAYLVEPMHEQADFAVNSLQVRGARRLTERLGNYSRFRFHHPGPTYFYYHAACELVLHDALGVAPSRVQAQLLGTIALQAACFVGALAIVAAQARRRWLLPLGALLGLLLLSRAHGAFASIWPPHVLLGPFFLLLSTVAAVARGRGGYLPLLAASGCALVHGHVAQPLFVVCLAVFAWSAAALTAVGGVGASAFVRRHRTAHLAALAIIALGLLPLALDLAAPRSNFDVVLAHMRDHPERAPWWMSGLYLVSFFLLRDDQLHGVSPLRSLPLLLAWPALTGLALVLRYRVRGAFARGRFGERWAATLVLTGVLFVVWARMQVEGFHQFNGFFGFALVVHTSWWLLAILGAPLGRLRGRLGPRGLTALWCMALVATACAASTLRPFGRESLVEGAAQQRSIAAAARGVAGPILVVFPHERWEVAATIVLSLERAGVRCLVDPSWEYMFGPERAATAWTGGAVWRVVRAPQPAPAPPDLALGGGLWLRTGASAPPTAGRFELSGERDADATRLLGTKPSFVHPGLFTTSSVVQLQLAAPRTPSPAVLELDYVAAGPEAGRRLDVVVNGCWVGTTTRSSGQLRCVLPPGLLAATDDVRLVLLVGGAQPPTAVDGALPHGDRLGFLLEGLRLRAP